MRKNDVVNVSIEDYGCNGEGIAKCDGKVVFVPYTVKGEKVEATIIYDKKSFFVGKVKNVLEDSSCRIKPQCQYFTKCGGCQLQHIDYTESLKIKTEIVQDAVNRIGKINTKVQLCEPCSLNYGYRNKLALPFDFSTRKIGIFASNSHRVVVIDDCVLQQSWCKKLISVTNEFVSKFQLSVYNEELHTGLLKHIVARAYNGALLVTIVLNGEELPHYEDYFSYLLAEFENVGLSININKLNNNVIMSEQNKHLCGLKKIEIEENGIKYSIDNASFMQVNNEIKNKIYAKVIQETDNCDVVVDAYSGAGLLTAMIAKTAKKVYGIEIVKPAVDVANELTRQNNIRNVSNICGDSAIELDKLSAELQGVNSCVVLDPPRKGCDEKVLKALNNVKPNKVVYISCNPSTLARDLQILSSCYFVEYIQPYDMFPQTKHVETVVLLRSKKDS